MTITEDNFRVCTMTKDQLKIVLENVSNGGKLNHFTSGD